MRLLINIFTAILILCSFPSHAANVSGIKLEEQITVDSQTLLLNGAGARERFIFDIYVIGLYLSEKQTDAAAILSSPPAGRVMMQFIYSKVEKEKMDEAWDEGFKNNVSGEKFESLKARLEMFKAMFDDAVEGDVYHFDHFPLKGTRITVNGTEKGWIEGEDFNSALLSVWLGESPVNKKLKNRLLGK